MYLIFIKIDLFLSGDRVKAEGETEAKFGWTK
jgi:hypothetical protein